MASTRLSNTIIDDSGLASESLALQSRFIDRLSALCAAARQHNLISESDSSLRFIVAFSGGLDSSVLLSLLVKSIPAERIEAVYIDHQLQSQSAEWGHHCIEFAWQLGIKCWVKRCHLNARSEEAAREARYAALSEYVSENTVLLMAHHADDQAETLLFRLARGTGPAGAAGIPAIRALAHGVLLRPLLLESRETLARYALDAQLSWVDDPTNAASDYDRNYLRHHVIHPLKERWPKAVEKMGQFALRVSEQTALLNELLDSSLSHCVDVQGWLDLNVLSRQSSHLQSALVRRFIEVRAQIRISEQECDRVFNELVLCKADAEPAVRLGNYELRRYRNQMWCIHCDHAATPKAVSGVFLPTSSLVDGNFCVALDSGFLTFETDKTGWIYCDRVTLCKDRSGLKVKPIKRPTKSLKSLFQEAAIPPWLRDSWPILMLDDRVVAVPNIAIAEQDETNGKENLRFALTWRPF